MTTALTETSFMPAMATARHARPDFTPEDLSIAERARAIWRTLKEDAGTMARITAAPWVKWIVYRLHREDDRSDPLELLGKLIVQLAALGVPEAFFRRIQLFVTEVIDECFPNKARRTLDELDREDYTREARENALQWERRIDSFATPDEMVAEADAIDAEVVSKIERSRVLRSEARRQRAGLTVVGAAAC